MTSTTKKGILKDDWVTTTKRYVGFLDIMGFKDMVLKSKNDDIYDMMKRIDNHLKSNLKTSSILASKNLIKTTTFSDSIIIYSKSDSKESLKSFVLYLSWFYFQLLIEKIPFKGAVALGEMTVDSVRSIYFGQPLIDAYLLQEELNFYGIVVHCSAHEKMESTEVSSDIRNYACNFKKGISEHLTIYTGKLNDKEKDKIFNSLRSMRFKTSGHIRKYIDLTEKYFENMCNNQ